MDRRLQKGRSLWLTMGAQEDRGGQAGSEWAWIGLRAELGLRRAAGSSIQAWEQPTPPSFLGLPPFSAEEAHLASIQLLPWTCRVTWAWGLLLSEAPVLTWTGSVGSSKP